jgi:hypothetical protein
MREQEVERRAAAVEHDGVQDVSQRLGGDEAGDCLVLLPRLAADVGERAREQEHR